MAKAAWQAAAWRMAAWLRHQLRVGIWRASSNEKMARKSINGRSSETAAYLIRALRAHHIEHDIAHGARSASAPAYLAGALAPLVSKRIMRSNM